MQRTQNAILWLQTKSKQKQSSEILSDEKSTDLFTRDRILQEAAARGVHPSRIFFAAKANRTE